MDADAWKQIVDDELTIAVKIKRLEQFISSRRKMRDPATKQDLDKLENFEAKGIPIKTLTFKRHNVWKQLFGRLKGLTPEEKETDSTWKLLMRKLMEKGLMLGAKEDESVLTGKDYVTLL
jgi:hypothetical protein